MEILQNISVVCTHFQTVWLLESERCSRVIRMMCECVCEIMIMAWETLWPLIFTSGHQSRHCCPQTVWYVEPCWRRDLPWTALWAVWSPSEGWTRLGLKSWSIDVWGLGDVFFWRTNHMLLPLLFYLQQRFYWFYLSLVVLTVWQRAT